MKAFTICWNLCTVTKKNSILAPIPVLHYGQYYILNIYSKCSDVLDKGLNSSPWGHGFASWVELEKKITNDKQ